MSLRKLLALRPANIRRKPSSNTLLEDAEIQNYLKDPRVWDAYMEVKKDASTMKKLAGDPTLMNILNDVSRKIAQYQKACVQ